jgi:hypothetical protein
MLLKNKEMMIFFFFLTINIKSSYVDKTAIQNILRKCIVFKFQTSGFYYFPVYNKLEEQNHVSSHRIFSSIIGLGKERPIFAFFQPNKKCLLFNNKKEKHDNGTSQQKSRIFFL